MPRRISILGSIRALVNVNVCVDTPNGVYDGTARVCVEREPEPCGSSSQDFVEFAGSFTGDSDVTTRVEIYAEDAPQQLIDAAERAAADIGDDEIVGIMEDEAAGV